MPTPVTASTTPIPVVIPWVNNWPMTLDCLQDVRSLVPPVGHHLEVILVGNGTSVQDDEACRAYLGTIHAPPRVSFFSPPFRLGLAQIWNQTLHGCWGMGADRCLVVNNDTRLRPDTLIRLVEVQDQVSGLFTTGIGVTEAQYETFRSDGREWVWSGETGGPDFSCFLISKACHERYQFDERFFPAYYEDNDYHRQLQVGGEGDRIFGVNLPFHHLGGGSGTLKQIRAEQGEEAAQAFKQQWEERQGRNREYYAEKWGGGPGREQFERPFNVAG